MPHMSSVILLVEDDPGDRALATRAIHGSAAVILEVVEDGQEALDYLYRRGAYTDPDASPRPDLVLLDLNTPRLNGHEVLSRMRADASLRSIPVVVLTTSADPDDIARAYDLGANSYIVKPIDMTRFVSVLDELKTYWFDTVRLPDEDAA